MPSPRASPAGEGANSKNGSYVAVLHLSCEKKQKACLKAGFLNLAPLTGLEPVTYGLTVRRSTD